MRKLLYSSAVLLSVISPSEVNAESSVLLERLNHEHVISVDPQSPFTSDRGTASPVTAPSSPVSVPSRVVAKKDTHEQEISALKRKLAISLREAEALKKKQAAVPSVQPTDSVRTENEQLRQQLQENARQLTEANKTRAEVNSQLDAAAKKMSEQAAQIVHLEDKLKQNREEQTQVQQALSVAQAKPRAQDAEQLQAMSRDKQQLQQQVQARDRQLAEAKTQNADLSTQLQLSVTKTADRDKQLTEANKTRAEVNSQLDAAAKKVSEQAAQIVNLEGKLKQSHDQQTQTQQALSVAQTKPRAQDAEQLQAMSRDKQQLQQQVQARDRQLAEAKAQNADLSTQLQLSVTKTAARDKQLTEVNKKRDEINSQLDIASKKSVELVSRITALEAQLKQSGEEKTQAEQQLAAAKAAPAALEKAPAKGNAPAFSLAMDKSELARTNYAWGVWFAAKVQLESETLKDVGQKFMPQAFLQGLQDKFSATLQMSNVDIEKVLSTLNKQVDDVRQRDIARNKKQGQQLLADAAKLKGAVRAENGVVYLVEKKGLGAAIGDNDIIRFKVDEKVSSGQVLAHGEINTVRMSELPLVMQTGVKKLVVGGRVRIYVPVELAYGEEGIPGAVPPGVTSVMTLEVLGIDK